MNSWKVIGFSSGFGCTAAITAATVVLGRTLPGLAQGSLITVLGTLTIAAVSGAVSWHRSPLVGVIAVAASASVMFGMALGWSDALWSLLSSVDLANGVNSRWLIALLAGAAIAFTVSEAIQQGRSK